MCVDCTELLVVLERVCKHLCWFLPVCLEQKTASAPNDSSARTSIFLRLGDRGSACCYSECPSGSERVRTVIEFPRQSLWPLRADAKPNSASLEQTPNDASVDGRFLANLDRQSPVNPKSPCSFLVRLLMPSPNRRGGACYWRGPVQGQMRARSGRRP